MKRIIFFLKNKIVESLNLDNEIREIDNWSNSLKFSTNVVVEVYNRLFSTSSELKAFDDYNSIEESYES